MIFYWGIIDLQYYMFQVYNLVIHKFYAPYIVIIRYYIIYSQCYTICPGIMVIYFNHSHLYLNSLHLLCPCPFSLTTTSLFSVSVSFLFLLHSLVLFFRFFSTCKRYKGFVILCLTYFAKHVILHVHKCC